MHAQSNAFGALLSDLRYARRISQAKLAERAESDHSTVSRLEQGTRGPSRAMVIRLAAALALDTAQCDRLLLSAGYAATDPTAAMTDADVRAIHALLDDDDAPLVYRHMARDVLRALIAGKPPALPAGSVEAV